MGTLLQTIIALALVWIFAYRRARMATILFSLLLALLAMSYYYGVAWLPWLVLLVVGFFYFASNLRMQKQDQSRGHAFTQSGEG